MELDAGTVLLQWATGGLAFLWVTTRHRLLGIGYGWLLRAVYGLMAAGAVWIGQKTDPYLPRDLAAAGAAGAAAAALAVSYARRKAGGGGRRGGGGAGGARGAPPAQNHAGGGRGRGPPPSPARPRPCRISRRPACQRLRPWPTCRA